MRAGVARTVGSAGTLGVSFGADCSNAGPGSGACSCPMSGRMSVLGTAGSAGGLDGTEEGGGIAEEARAPSCVGAGAGPGVTDDSGRTEVWRDSVPIRGRGFATGRKTVLPFSRPQTERQIALLQTIHSRTRCDIVI